MITKINKLINFGNFQEFEWDKELEPFNAINIIYGYNGSGKTTISNLFYLLSKNCIDKEEFIKEYLSIKTVIEIEIDKKIKHANQIKDINLDIYIFNTKFINDHVYNGSVANISSFSSDIKLTNEIINNIDNRVIILNSRIEKLKKWSEFLNDKFINITQKYKDDFGKKISGPRLTEIPSKLEPPPPFELSKYQEYLIGIYSDYEKKDKEEEIKKILNEFSEKANSLKNIEINLIELNSRLSKKLDEKTRQIIKDRIIKIHSSLPTNLELKNIDSLNEWYLKGKYLLEIKQEEDQKCPLCNSDISHEINSIIVDYTNYFTTEILELNKYIDNMIDILNKFYQEINDGNTGKILSIMYVLNQNNYTLDIKEFERILLLKDEFIELIKILKNKKDEPNKEFHINENSIKTIIEYSIYVTNIISRINSFVNDELLKLSNQTKTDNLNIIKTTIREIILIEFNLTENTILKDSEKRNYQIANKIEELIKIFENNLDNLRSARNKEIIKLRAESKFMNMYLELLGIDKFNIDKDNSKSRDNIKITYINGSVKMSLKYSLSESEKTALAFAYFLSKIRVEKLLGVNNGFKDCIIVIDDPVSSLDENRLFQTANIIQSFFFYNNDSNNTIPLQFFLLSHNINFLKYFNNAIKSNINFADKICEYFISPYKSNITELPNGLKNFTNTYIIKLKDIIDYKDNDSIIYSDARKFIPNFIRIVLETFLSFKFAIVKDSRDGLPGLSNLISHAIKEINNYPDVIISGINKNGCIERLNDLKKISDFESHGNISKIEDINFISELELKEFCKKTIKVIQFLDKIHFYKVKGII